MKDFSISEIFGLLAKTTPFLVFRFLVYFGIILGFVLAAGFGAGIGYGIGAIGGDGASGGALGGFVGLGVAGAILFFLRRYLLYLVKAGHIAVLVELLEGKDLPGGRGQIDHAQRVVRERFVESSVLFGLDQIIKGVLRAFNRAFLTVARLIPLPGLDTVIGIANRIITLSLTYLDEVILSFIFRSGTANPWTSGRTSLVLYAQNYKAFLKNAVWLMLAIWGLTFLVFLVCLAPAAGVVALFPGAGGFIMLVFALIFAWGVKQAVIEPFAVAAMMQVFYRVTEGQAPNAEWEAKLEGVSRRFGRLKEKATEWSPAGAPEVQPVATL